MDKKGYGTLRERKGEKIAGEERGGECMETRCDEGNALLR